MIPKHFNSSLLFLVMALLVSFGVGCDCSNNAEDDNDDHGGINDDDNPADNPVGIGSQIDDDDNDDDTFIPATGLCTADGWCWMNPRPQGNSLNSVWVSAGGKVFTVGDYGTAMVYENDEFSNLSPTVSSTLRDIWAADENHLVVVGDSGTIIHYNDGQWSSKSIENKINLFAVDGTSVSDIWAVGQNSETNLPIIAHFNGTEWTITTGESQGSFYSVDAISTTNVYVGGDFTQAALVLWHYNGNEWTEMIDDQQIGWSTIRSIQAFSASSIYVAGDHGICYYDGNSWTHMSIGTSLDYLDYVDVWGSAADNVFAVTNQGLFIHYNGSSWSVISNDPEGRIYTHISGNSATNVFVTGEAGVLLHYDGGAVTQIAPNYDCNIPEYSHVWGIDEKDIWLLGDPFFHFDGTNWTEVIMSQSVSDLWGYGFEEVFTAGTDGVLHYHNGLWQELLHEDNSGVSIERIHGSSPTNVWVLIGENQEKALFRYNGDTWSQELSADDPSIMTINGFWVNGESDLFLAGQGAIAKAYGGIVWRFDGSHLTPLYSRPNTNFLDLRVFSEQEIVAIGRCQDEFGDLPDVVVAYDGTQWNEMEIPNPMDYYLNRLIAFAPDDIYITTSSRNDQRSIVLTLHYDGMQWRAENSGVAISSMWQAPGGAVIGVGPNGGSYLHANGILRRSPK